MRHSLNREMNQKLIVYYIVTDENIMHTNVFLKFKDEKGNELNFVSNIKKSS